MRKQSLVWLKLLFSLGLLSYLIRRADAGQIYAVAANGQPSFFLLALGIVFVDMTIRAYNWKFLLQSQQVRMPFLQIIYIHWVSTFLGMFLPSSLGADMVKAQQLSSVTLKVHQSISSVFVMNLFSLLGLSLFSVSGLLLASHGRLEAFPPQLFPIVLSLSLGVTVTVGVMLNSVTWNWAGQACGLVPWTAANLWLKKLFDSMSDYNRQRRALLVCLISSFVNQFLAILIPYLAAQSLKLGAELASFLLFVPLISILTMLPVSVAGVGVRESGFVYFFSKAGLSVAGALSVSLYSFMVYFTLAALGGIVYAVGRGYELRHRSSNSRIRKTGL